MEGCQILLESSVDMSLLCVIDKTVSAIVIRESGIEQILFTVRACISILIYRRALVERR